MLSRSILVASNGGWWCIWCMVELRRIGGVLPGAANMSHNTKTHHHAVLHASKKPGNDICMCPSVQSFKPVGIFVAEKSGAPGAYLIFVTGTTGGARGEKNCHVEKFVHMTDFQVEKFST